MEKVVKEKRNEIYQNDKYICEYTLNEIKDNNCIFLQIYFYDKNSKDEYIQICIDHNIDNNLSLILIDAIHNRVKELLNLGNSNYSFVNICFSNVNLNIMLKHNIKLLLNMYGIVDIIHNHISIDLYNLKNNK